MVRALTEANGHAHFGIYAEVICGAEIAELNEVALTDTPAEVTP